MACRKAPGLAVGRFLVAHGYCVSLRGNSQLKSAIDNTEYMFYDCSVRWTKNDS